MDDNINDCCRICLDVDSDHVPVLDNVTVELHLKYCLGITVAPTDELPKTICVSCVAQLSEFYSFQLNARFSQDWLESTVQERCKKSTEMKPLIQPLPDSEYNSDSLLEFLNNTANIEEYLNNLGKEDIPSIVNLLDKNSESSLDAAMKATATKTKQLSPRKNERNSNINMDIDVLDSEIDVVKEILMKETEPKKLSPVKNTLTCFACSITFENLNRLSQHVSTCDMASRTCIQCNKLFDSKQKMQQHTLSHNSSELTCNCGKQFITKEKLSQHHKVCHIDYTASMGCIYRCKQCNETFRERFQLYKHAKQHVLKADERICDVCGHSFPGEDALSRHRKEEHGKSNDLLYRCKVCCYTSPDHKDVYKHVQSHLAKEETRHLCETCGRCFATKATLIRHTLLHGDLPKCNICHTTFTSIKSRDSHVLEHIEMTMCEKCGQNVNCYKLENHTCV